MAVELSEEVRVQLAEASARLRRCPVRASWVRPEHMHLTLRFLAECDDDQVKSLTAQLRERLVNAASFDLRVQGVGAFPNLRRPSVVWVGAVPADGPLSDVQAHCDQAARAVGLPPETKPFHPHITLARIKDHRPPDVLTAEIERERAFDAGAFQVTGVSLFRSELTPRGPVYTRLEEFRFE